MYTVVKEMEVKVNKMKLFVWSNNVTFEINFPWKNKNKFSVEGYVIRKNEFFFILTIMKLSFAFSLVKGHILYIHMKKSEL